MKKLIAIALVMVLALSLLTACGGGNSNTPSGGNNNTPSGNSSTPGGNDNNPGGNNSTPSGNDNTPGNTGNRLTMSITVPNGWKESDSEIDKLQKEGFGTITYMPDAEPGTYPLTLFSLTPEENIFNKSEREFVEDRLKNEKTYFGEQNDYTDISEVTLGGHKALRFTKTHKDMGLFTVYTYIHKGDYIYIVQQSTYEEFMDELSNDFDAMYESFTLK